MNVHLLINEVMRQTTVLIAQLSTAAGTRAPLAHLADQVFLELSKELEAQGVRRNVAADMFGMMLRSYQMKLRRLTDADAQGGESLWQALYLDLAEGSRTRSELIKRHRPHPEKQIAAALQDMTQTGLAYCSGRGADMLYGLTTQDDRNQLSLRDTEKEGRNLCWYLVACGSADSRRALREQLKLDADTVDALVDGLVSEGQLTQDANGLRARRFSIALGAEHGWETAVLDQFRAVTTTIAARLNRRDANTSAEVGGATRSFLVYPEHPFVNEVLGLLSETRSRTAALWQRVSEYNEQHPPPEEAARVTFYFGQNVVRPEPEDSQFDPNDD